MNKVKKAAADAQKLMQGFTYKQLPTYAWLTVLSQLTSRICHINQACVQTVAVVLVEVAAAYPQQVRVPPSPPMPAC